MSTMSADAKAGSSVFFAAEGAPKRPSTFAAASKFRHMFGTEAPKSGTFFNLQPTLVASDGPVIACNATHWAIPYNGGGGPIYVSSLSTPGKREPGCRVLHAHKAAVQDINFSAFHADLMAAASLDCTISIWNNACSSSDADIEAKPACVIGSHSNSVRTVDFHPTVPNLLVSTGLDMTIRLSDVTSGRQISLIDTNADGGGADSVVNNVAFSLDGLSIAAACRDKNVRVIDPRVGGRGGVVGTYTNPNLGRNSRIAWLSNQSSGSAFLTCGSISNGQRVLSLWDARKGEVVLTKSVDVNSGQLFPLLDESTGLCFLVGKGDTVVKYYETTFLGSATGGDVGSCDKAAEFQTSLQPFAGVCMLPKQCCDLRNVECARLLKLTSDSVAPLSFYTPRSDALKEYFQDDLFPPVRSYQLDGSPSIEMFVGGAAADAFCPALESLQPEGMVPLSQRPTDHRRASNTRSDEFREAQAKELAEKNRKEEEFARLQALANQHAKYNPNPCMDGGGADVAEDEWD